MANIFAAVTNDFGLFTPNTFRLFHQKKISTFHQKRGYYYNILDQNDAKFDSSVLSNYESIVNSCFLRFLKFFINEILHIHVQYMHYILYLRFTSVGKSLRGRPKKGEKAESNQKRKTKKDKERIKIGIKLNEELLQRHEASTHTHKNVEVNFSTSTFSNSAMQTLHTTPHHKT